MIASRWRKVLADLWGNKVRSLLVILSIAVGVFAVGLISSTLFMVQRDMQADYLPANPHAARVFADVLDERNVAALRNVPGVAAVEGRYEQNVKINAPDGNQYVTTVNSIPPLGQIVVDKIVFESGSRQLRSHELYLERQGASGMGLRVGDTVTVELPDGRTRALTLAGTVHDVQANPFKFTSQTSGYVSHETMAWLGGSNQYNYVWFTVAGDPTNEEHVREVAEAIAGKIRRGGGNVTNININRPGQHPAQSTIDTMMALLGAMGVLAVLLSGFLVVNSLSALMGQQRRQIAVMKAIGATVGQMVAMYMALVLGLGALALLVAVPLASVGAYVMGRWLAGMLNATPGPFFVHPVSLGLQVAIGLAVPLAAAIAPVLGGARLTVLQAMSNYGLSTPAKPGLLDRLVELLRGLPRPLLLSLRNTFRRKGRLALTLSTLVLGGAIFIAVFGVRESMILETERAFGYYQSDVNVDYARPYLLRRAGEDLGGIPGIAAIEGWGAGRATVLRPGQENGDVVVIYAPPEETNLVYPVMMEGRWLVPADENAIVIPNHLIKARPEIKVGDMITLRFDEKDFDFHVVGICKVAGQPPLPVTYMNRGALAVMAGEPAKVTTLRIVTDRHDAARQEEVLRAVRARYEALGIDVTLETGSQIIAQKNSQTDILTILLLLMALLIAAVGGLGLMGTMSMNVLERTREIGVLRSIGAENGAIFQLVVVEGLLIGFISWALGVVVGIPITRLLDQAIGLPLMNVPLTYILSRAGIGIWLVVVLALAALASILPARNAVRLTIRDVLAYE